MQLSKTTKHHWLVWILNYEQAVDLQASFWPFKWYLVTVWHQTPWLTDDGKSGATGQSHVHWDRLFPRQRLRNMDASRYCVVTLIALSIEAFFSPVWLNSNGLRFDFSPRTRQENPNNNTHTQTAPAGNLGKREHAGKRKRVTTVNKHQVTTRQTERWSHG